MVVGTAAAAAASLLSHRKKRRPTASWSPLPWSHTPVGSHEGADVRTRPGLTAGWPPAAGGTLHTTTLRLYCTSCTAGLRLRLARTLSTVWLHCCCLWPVAHSSCPRGWWPMRIRRAAAVAAARVQCHGHLSSFHQHACACAHVLVQYAADTCEHKLRVSEFSMWLARNPLQYYTTTAVVG